MFKKIFLGTTKFVGAQKILEITAPNDPPWLPACSCVLMKRKFEALEICTFTQLRFFISKLAEI